jgi:hypothetical protein
MRQRCWLKRYATSRKIALSIPDEINGFFFRSIYPVGRTMALAPTQPLKEMNTKNLPAV